MEGLFIAAVLIVPPLLVATLNHTRLHWLAGALLLAAAFYIFSQVQPVDADESDAGLGGIANALSVAAGIVLSIYGLVMLLVSSRLHERHRKRLGKLPPARTVAAGVYKR
jgi:hypothetical protein